MDDTKDVYMRDTLFLEQVGKRKEPTRYIIDDTLDIYAVENYYKVYVAIPAEEEERLTMKSLVGHLRFEPEYLMFQPDNKRGGILNMMEYLEADKRMSLYLAMIITIWICFIPTGFPSLWEMDARR